ncbi:MAG TPA: beta-ketoacyl synthase N-terminal-like domain-containing protein, partial [Thermoanaerobaculia bacterium]
VGPEDRLLFVTALSFDLSVYDLFGTLAAGGTVRLATSEEVRDPQRLVRILREEGITFWDSAPAMLQSCEGWFGDERTTPLRLVFLSGDWIPVTLPDRVRAAFPNAEFVSLGGATEATVWSNFYPVRDVDPAWTSIPYGRPIANARYHVLDPALAPCPIGVPGDLCIGGPCLSLGYAADPAQTAAKYLPSPWGPEPGARLYQTGDRARWLADGNLEFLGRRDTQVKVRGFRIELGEIETVLAAHPGVREAVVLAREASAGDRRLVAYFIPEGGGAPDVAALRRHLQAKLPDYMLPAAYVPLAAWPLSATGKLDRKALPPSFTAPAPAPPAPAAATATPAAPAGRRGEVERGLAALWREVIGIEQVGPDDNFFELGGHSLLLARVHARLPELVGRTVPMIDLFKHPTVASLAAHLATSDGAAPGPAAAAEPRAAPATDGRIAVVGMAGRFPGARDVEELWANLRGGVESIYFFADDELLAAGVPAAQLADPRYVRARGVLGGTDLFDAPFFDVTPREAQALDPQQRLFLECAWQALEDAGHAGQADSAADLRVGVYAGASENGYLHLLLASPAVLRAVGRYGASLANNPDYLATRVSYKLDLQGPSLSVQTACSTSLVAVHLACRSLLAGDCDLALAGGVSVRVPEVEGYLYEEGGIASPDGHTRPFDAAAAGTVRSSGAGVVALKRLADALADGDAIRAVVLGSAINNDGARKVGFTAPAVRGQAAVVREAQRRAGVAPETVTFVEAHGTATALGDPIELTALTEAFRAGTDRAGFCALGSVKSNLGHTDAAAGVAGLLKTVLALENRELPPSLHFRAPNPKLGLPGSPFYVAAALAPWEPPVGTPRRAGVSSFGIGGTNAHLVLEEAPVPEPGPRPSRPAQLLLVSAKTPAALEEATARLAARLDRADGWSDEELADAAFTLQGGRKAMRHRRAVVCRGRAGAAAALRGADPWRLAAGACLGEVTPVCFLLPGQGAQHVGMGKELYAAEPAFRDALDRCCELLAPELGLDLRALLYPPAGADREDAARRLEQTALAQPALFAVEAALAELWASWGVRPRALLGHSLGEYVAAYLAGVFSLADGLRLVAARGRLMQALPAGAMLAVPLGEEEVKELLGKEEGGGVSLAAVNAPSACVVSGPADAVDAFAARLAERQIAARRLHTSHAFHSAMMEPAVAAFRAVVETVPLRPPGLPYLSNVTGGWITAAEATDPGYWARHLRQTVRFGDGLATLLAGDPALVLEVGPGQTLSTFARRQPAAADRVVPSLPRAKDRRPELDTLLGA